MGYVLNFLNFKRQLKYNGLKKMIFCTKFDDILKNG